MRHRRLILAIAISALIAAGCGNDDSDDVAQPAESVAGGSDLVIGQVMPETGSLAFLNSPMIEGIGLAMEDILGAGGNVQLLTGDTATDPDVAPETVNRLLGEGPM